MLVVEIREFGGPEQLEQVERPAPVAGPGQVLVEHRAIGALRARAAAVFGDVLDGTLPVRVAERFALADAAEAHRAMAAGVNGKLLLIPGGP
jgi:NADPH:quinone reductase-like Zn-dependent oxidoreductase